MTKWIRENEGKYTFLPERNYQGVVASHVIISIEDYEELVNIKQIAEETDIERKASIYKKMYEHEKSLNQNLIRVATERANKSREREKTDNGYIVISWQPFHYKRTYKTGYRATEVKYYLYYKITVQTPWDCSIPRKEVDRLVLEAMYNKELNLADGMDIYHYDNMDIELDDAIDGEQEGQTLVLTRQYRCDGKAGLWEVTFTANFEPIIPEKHRVKYV